MLSFFCWDDFPKPKGNKGMYFHMDVEPKIGGKKNPKWIVKIREHPIKIDDLGGTPIFWKHAYFSRFENSSW